MSWAGGDLTYNGMGQVARMGSVATLIGWCAQQHHSTPQSTKSAVNGRAGAASNKQAIELHKEMKKESGLLSHQEMLIACSSPCAPSFCLNLLRK